MNPSHPENLLHRISEALDEPGGIPAALLAEARTYPDAREFLAFWTGDVARTLESPLPPCGIALRDGIFKLADTRNADEGTDTSQIPQPAAPASRHPWFSAAAAAAIVIGCGWLLYQKPVSPSPPAAAGYEVTPDEIAAIARDIDHGLDTVGKPLSAMRMTLARLDTH